MPGLICLQIIFYLGELGKDLSWQLRLECKDREPQRLCVLAICLLSEMRRLEGYLSSLIGDFFQKLELLNKGRSTLSKHLLMLRICSSKMRLEENFST